MDTNKEKLEARVFEVKLKQVESVMSLLFDASRLEDATEDPAMESNYQGLYDSMEGIAAAQQEQILQWITLIQQDAERDGFERGVKLGFKLREELG